MDAGFQSHDYSRRPSVSASAKQQQQKEQKQQQKYPHPPPAPPRPHFRRRITSESTSSSTIEIDTRAHIPGINKRKSSDSGGGYGHGYGYGYGYGYGNGYGYRHGSHGSYGHSAEDRYYDDSSSAFKRRMTMPSRDDDDEDDIECREPSSPPPPPLSSVSVLHDPHREVKRVGSSELASAMALASLAYGNPSHRQGPGPHGPHGPNPRNVFSTGAATQELFPGKHSGFPSKAMLEHFDKRNSNNAHHTNPMYQYGYNFPPQGYYPGLPEPQEQSQQQQQQQQQRPNNKRQWVCDYCNKASFSTYEDACAHESQCQYNSSLLCRETRDEGDDVITMPMTSSTSTNNFLQEGNIRDTADDMNMGRVNVDTTTTNNMNVPDQIHSSSKNGVYYAGEISLSVTATDSDWLSETNCYVRSKCVEAFSAKEGDIMISSKRGRISLHQVGVRCKFCAGVDARERSSGAVSFPVSVSGIYESVKRWKSVHLPECKHIPDDVKQKIKTMEKSSCVPTTRQYWIDSAKALGIDDTPDGLRFIIDPSKFDQDDAQNSMIKTRFAPSLAKRNAAKDGGPKKQEYIVYPEDKSTITPYVYCLIRQVQPCVFTEADRFLSRSKSKVGFAGFECRHCNGHAGLGRYFPSTPKALSTNSTSQNIYSHVQKCRKCPQEVKDELKNLKFEKPTWLRRSCGWRQTFFEKLWERLHG